MFDRAHPRTGNGIRAMVTRSGASAMLVAAALLSGCATVSKPEEPPPPPSHKHPHPPPPPPKPSAPLPPIEKPQPKPSAGEQALAEGIKSYQGSQYRRAEAQLKAALKAGLSRPSDRANAHKHLAFIYCTSQRSALCAAAFKNAKAADPNFALTKAEAGHPMWAKTYRRALGIK